MRTEKVIINYHTEEEKELPLMDRSMLSMYHTKQLLDARGHGISQMKRSEFIFCRLNGYWAVNVGDLLDELATRPHIPNKIEARKIRQEKAKR